MSFKKTYHDMVILTRKVYLNSTKFMAQFTSLKSSFKIIKGYSRFSNILLASAALGLSVYVARNRTILCETTDNMDITELINTNIKSYDEAICKSRDLLQRLKDEAGIPGIVIGVSINGKTIWTEGLGYADIENRVRCSADTVMRIASISKSITMAAVAKLWEQDKLDIDKPVQHYVPDFPLKTYNGKPVSITCRQLVSHLGGIRHYDKNVNETVSKKIEKGTDENSKKTTEKTEFEHEEYYIKEHYKDVTTSLNIFKDDPLVANPGSKYSYSTHGWTVISAVVEAASKETFSIHMTKLFKSLGMSTTYLDVNDDLIYYRSRNYVKDKKGKLINAPFVDNSYKWAGGGFLSTVCDLLRFGNIMLYSLQFEPVQVKRSEKEKNVRNINKSSSNCPSQELINFNQTLPGFLKAETVKTLWTPVTDAKESKYGMGWAIIPEKSECFSCESKKLCVYHTGSAVGASSVLLILPQKATNDEINELNEICGPKGIVVTILTNLDSIKLSKTALKVAEIFKSQSQEL